MSAPAIIVRQDSDQRRFDRRSGDRRAPRRSFDPLFVATLVNQIEPDTAARATAYPAPHGPRPGIAFNLNA